MESLENCNITLVDSNTNYKFYDCKVDILDANKYFASGITILSMKIKSIF